MDDFFFLTEKVLASMLLLCGLSVMIRTSLWVRLVNWMSRLTDQQLASLISLSSMIFLPLGLVIVWTHNVWEWSPSVIVTFMGWGILCKHIFFLFCPERGNILRFLHKKGEKFLTFFLRFFGILYVLLALLVLQQYWL